MRCEILAIGTELLLGQVIDTNSAWLAEQLALHGIDCHYQTRVDDTLPRIVDALRIALARSDIVITCGGLGPTQDDITREAIAQFMNVRLRRDAQIQMRIEAIFRARNRPFSQNNARQADVPEGATTMNMLTGTAPGLICPIGKKRIYALPGVPSEMRAMFTLDALPDIQRFNESAVILSHTFYCWGQGESAISERLASRFIVLEQTGNPSLAFLADERLGVRVRLTAKAHESAQARCLLEQAAQG
ncbi:MAG: hypothetical protein LBS40_01970 [Burkholderiales bacterium]|jgi:nicotinamide-nucleotide amidase|nr:hypothetical protein [Burkholderiales bacterium]